MPEAGTPSGPEPGRPEPGRPEPGRPEPDEPSPGDLSPQDDDLAVERASVARLYDFFLGGRRNFAADRELGRRLLDLEPGILQAVRTNRAFLGRAVRFLARSGIGQFLDLGAGIPAAENVHEIARRISPDARVGYVDSDPSAVAHSRQALDGDPAATAVRYDLRDTDGVLADEELRKLIDLSEPVGILMIAVLHYLPDDADPAGVIRRYAGRIAPGSYLVLAHPTFESCPAAGAIGDLYATGSASRVHLRSRAAVTGFLDGLEIAEPGIVHLPLWRPDGPVTGRPERALSYGGVARMPGSAPDPSPDGARR